MKKFALALLFLGMACLPMKADIVVKPSVEKGNIKPMNAVNNGPERSGASQQSDNFEAYKAARIPYARTHDSSFNANYGSEHTVDISAVFPDFSRDPGKAENYDFAVTDKYLRNIQDAGTKVFFRLGQKIEHYVRKYNVCPPSDNRKWARICEHIIRHYNEGWADGMHLGIEYWEIWNEPDLDDSTWKGTPEQFYDLYETTAKHLKKCFPELKIGGPAATGRRDWSEAFLAEMARRKVPIDFYSWHRYTVDPGNFVMNATYFRELLDSNGYTGTESIIDEWNYVKGWRETYPASLQVIASEKGGAYTAAVMCAVQDCPVDMLMYYDARTGTRFNGLFDYQSNQPLSAYYALYAWSHLLYDYGTCVEAVSDEEDIYTTAAKSPSGKMAILVSRYNEDDNDVAARVIKIKAPGIPDGTVYGHLTDKWHNYTEVPLNCSDGEISVTLQPSSFILIEW